ncbi:MAG: pantoate--beta-alanine ligase [Pirellulales bacterium]
MTQMGTGLNGPRIVTRREEALTLLRAARAAGQRIGVVPTMGALHAGHVSLARAAREACDLVVATIFVNPTQFGPHEDFQRYPRTLPADLEQLRSAGTDLVFVPDAEEMYPSGSTTMVEPPAVAARWEGACRPGHFRGVATVVLKLFLVLPADVAYFGAKDYQQTLVVRRMVADLLVPIRIEVCPTVRDDDGLALSSRNRYLSAEERVRALSLSRGLRAVAAQFQAGERSRDALEACLARELTAGGVDQIDYAAVVEPETLEPVDPLGHRAVALVAARVGGTRLIDNQMLE